MLIPTILVVCIFSSIKLLISSISIVNFVGRESLLCKVICLRSGHTSSVLFAGALEKIPADAVVVEVSPHGLLQAILRRSLPQATPIPLIRKDASCVQRHFLEAVGK